jgi:hypothetical protein
MYFKSKANLQALHIYILLQYHNTHNILYITSKTNVSLHTIKIQTTSSLGLQTSRYKIQVQYEIVMAQDWIHQGGV